MKTALYEKHTGLNAKMIEFAGYLMPVQYEGVVAEHLCVKENVGVFDVSHMGEFYVFGDKTEDFLQSVLSNDVSTLKKGQAQYNCIPNETGGIVDDLILYKLESDRFMLVVNASNIKKDWDFLNKKNVFDVQMINVSNDYSLISVQGPKSINVLQSIFDFDMNTIKYYNFIFSDGLIISNTGYTGCGGFEIYCKNEKASDLWDKIFKVGENYNIKAIGLAARDTLRLEMGFCLYGNDIDDESSPIEAGLTWITKTDKVFTSSELFKNQKENGVSKKLIGFKMLEKAIPRKDYEILNSKNEIIGKVTSGTMSPSLGFGIGLGYVKCGFEKIDTEIYIKIRKNIKKAIIVKTPFK
tara:strand:- start:331 stop:1389 length:1059 start_codon:yes stop_codon:yes gene_type:complete